MAEIAPRSLGRDVTREQELTESLQGSERRAQLVGRNGEELILGLIQLAQASCRPRYLFLELLGEVALALREARVLEGEREVKGQGIRKSARGRRQIAVALDDQGSHGPLPRVESHHQAPARRRPRTRHALGGAIAVGSAGRYG